MPLTFNREELAWAAGFFDGEGSIHVCYSSKTSGKTYPQIAIGQSGEIGDEVLRRFQRAVGGLGKIYGPRPPGKNQTKIRWVFEANGFLKCQAVMAMLWSWLGNAKRAQFLRCTQSYLETRRYYNALHFG